MFPERGRSVVIDNLAKSIALGKSIARGESISHQDSAVSGTSESKSMSNGLTTKQHTLITEALGDELSATFESEPLLMWVKERLRYTENGTDHLMHYIQTNEALRDWVSDGSRCSIYAHDDKAAFFRTMVEGSPFVLDALLESSSTEVQRFAAESQIQEA